MKKETTIFGWVLILSFLLGSHARGQAIWYVNNDGPGGDGTSWQAAFSDLQAGLDAAVAGDEIWVSEGTYYPTSDYGLGVGDRGKHFRMINGVGIYGGFPDMDHSGWEDRDPNMYVTILSGDLLGNDDPNTFVDNLRDDPSRADNCYHVFYHPSGTNLNVTAKLEGFFITGSNANGAYSSHFFYGGGMYNINNHPTVISCTFFGNSANIGGGMYNSYSNPTVINCDFITNSGNGMYNKYFSNPTVANCTFSGNSFADGGGMSNFHKCNPVVSNCSFIGNRATGGGGGMYNLSSSPKVSNCIFSNNSAIMCGGMFNIHNSNANITSCIFSGNLAYRGGGMYNASSNVIVINCIFRDNQAVHYGGGMHNVESIPVVSFCTFTGNRASYGGGMYTAYDSIPTVSNCIIWGNVATNSGNANWNHGSSGPIFRYCDIAGCFDGGLWDTLLGKDGGGNIDADPVFVDTGARDYHLRVGSPCIDAGSDVGVYEDIDGVVRPWDDPRVDHNGPGVGEFDMGAYEFVNVQPMADAGEDQVVWAEPNGLAIVRLDGSGSFDGDGDTLSYRWSWVVDGVEYVSFGGDGVVNMLDYAWWAKNAGETPAVHLLAELAGAWLADAKKGTGTCSPSAAQSQSPFSLDVAGGGAYLVIELPVGVHEVSLVVNDGIEDSEADTCLVTVLGAGDLDGDGIVGVDDLDILLADRGQPASGEDDPRDLDGDGMVTVLDARMLVTLFTK